MPQLGSTRLLTFSARLGSAREILARNSSLTNTMFFLGLFVFAKDVTKTKYLQILTTVMRWTAFIIMITLAGLRLSRGIIFRPPVSDFSGVPNLFGVCVYSFMCHHSLPSLGNMPILSTSSHCYFRIF